MILTMKRVDALKKLEDAKARALRAIERSNATIDQRSKQAREKRIKEVEKYLNGLRNGKGFDDYESFQRLTEEKPKEVVCPKFDAAIGMLRLATDETITINTERDKSGLAEAIIEAFS